ncbi:ankyrin repeat-containing domain protein [Schizophyllum amplum]|uniref:Ankyrin repeat-containing domain protein n=1 Tax=Schizophyllum amplum TaxID=97359 RepID=A0A550CK16_9AGAR|nr:ankyrin repeat-containing domain protein [Auriculariopsis ampla]
MARPPKNIWVAAGDGDLERVQVTLSPNIPDENTYTPMHAAASYGQLQVLEYLISRGGDVNVIDSDGDTPLYTVEDVATAQFLVDHGATVARTNHEGISPIDHLREDFDDVASFLEGVISGQANDAPQTNGNGHTIVTAALPPSTSTAVPSQHSQNAASEALTSTLMASVQEIMQRAEAEGREPDESELRAVVSRTVLEGVAQGFVMSATEDADMDGAPAEKRQRGDGS